MYLTSLEKVRAVSSAHLHAWGGLSDAASAGAASFVAGFCASLATQAVSVPIDVVSQRLMIADRVERSYEAGASHVHAPHEGPKPRYAGGLQAFRAILAQEGLRGLYRGLPVSLVSHWQRGCGVVGAWAHGRCMHHSMPVLPTQLTYAPSSAIWWSAYSTYQKLLWHALGLSSSGDGGGGASVPWVGAVQVASGVAAGATSGFLTAPLDVVKTRLQVRGWRRQPRGRMACRNGPVPANEADPALPLLPQVTRAARGEAQPTVRAVVRDLFARDGLRGMFRGVAPRMASSALWGTAMVSAYEFLKRVCAKETSDAAG